MQHATWRIAALVGFVAVVLAFGLAETLRKNLEPAPRAQEAQRGRLHPHLKNITRFGGAPEHVARSVHRAVFLADQGTDEMVAQPMAWRRRIENAAARPDGNRPAHVIVLAEEGPDAPAWALPGAYWAVWAGAPVVFVGRGGVTPGIARRLRELRRPAYVIAPSTHIPDRIVAAIGEIVPVRRVAGDSLASHAVTVAEVRDPTTGFGWGRNASEVDGYGHFVIAAPADTEQALAGLPLARSNAAAFLFGSDDGGLPAETDRYLWTQKSQFYETPAEGPFRHLFVLGDRVSYASLGRMDLAIEKAPYPSLALPAAGPMDALAVVFFAAGFTGAVFVWVHARRMLPELGLAAVVAWTFTALLVPGIGVLLYFAAYRRPRTRRNAPIAQWLRPPAIQAAAGTAMGFGFGAPLMIAIGWLFAWFGFPLFFGPWAVDGPEFLLGAGMVLMMAGMYVGAVLIAWPLAQAPMKAMLRGVPARRFAWSSLGVTAVSMAAVSLGMMLIAWWMQMWKLPMMPHEDEILWYFSMWLAATAGFLVAWPLNAPMVRIGWKPGTT